jgi:hypothetical protein
MAGAQAREWKAAAAALAAHIALLLLAPRPPLPGAGGSALRPLGPEDAIEVELNEPVAKPSPAPGPVIAEPEPASKGAESPKAAPRAKAAAEPAAPEDAEPPSGNSDPREKLAPLPAAEAREGVPIGEPKTPGGAGSPGKAPPADEYGPPSGGGDGPVR